MSIDTNSNLRLKEFLNLSCFDTWAIVKELNFFSTIKTILRDITPIMYTNSSVILTK